MGLCRSAASFMKITPNNYRIISRTSPLIGAAEIFLGKSITIQISIFQSCSIVNETVQTLKALSSAAGECSSKSSCGRHS